MRRRILGPGLVNLPSNLAWKRVCDKCSPSKMTTMSPINPIYAHTSNKSIVDDPLLEGLSLSVMLSEENHYVNIISTIHEFYDNPTEQLKVLQNLRSRKDHLARLKDIYYMSSGAFGSVYEATDRLTNSKVALKKILPKDSDQYVYMLSIWKIFIERSILMTTNDCPFFTHMIASFQSKNGSSFWIMMEYCDCNLGEFCENLHGSINLQVVNHDFLNDINIIDKISQEATKKINFPYDDLILIYFFEMLCALHFLADRHIVHCDLKLDNILMARNGHIKLADLGAAQIYRLVNKRSALYINQDFDNLKEVIDQQDAEYKRSGNVVFLDPESTMRYLSTADNRRYKELIKRYNLDPEDVDERVTRQTFLTDLYAAGAITMTMFLGGMLIAHPFYYNLKTLKRYNVNELDLKFFNVAIGFHEQLFRDVIYPKFRNSFPREYKLLAKVIATTIVLRKDRAKIVLRDVTVYRNKDVTTEKAIDIKLLEELNYYKIRKVTMATVTHIFLPKDVMTFCMNKTSKSNREKINLSDLDIEENPSLLSSLNFQFLAPK